MINLSKKLDVDQEELPSLGFQLRLIKMEYPELKDDNAGLVALLNDTFDTEYTVEQLEFYENVDTGEDFELENRRQQYLMRI